MNIAFPLLAALILVQVQPTPSTVPTPSTPPLVTLPDAVPPPGEVTPVYPWAPSPTYAPRPPRAQRPGHLPAPMAPAKGAVNLAALSLFGLFLGGDVEFVVTPLLALYAGAGGGLFGQLTAEVGVRVYVQEQALEGLFVEGHGQGFFVPATRMALLGPGVQLGYAWRTNGSMQLAVGVGASLWFSVGSRTGGLRPFTPPSYDSVLVFPGIETPVPGSFSVQPTVRVTVGPAF